jgi:hypothetical protein
MPVCQRDRRPNRGAAFSITKFGNEPFHVDKHTVFRLLFSRNCTILKKAETVATAFSTQTIPYA